MNSYSETFPEQDNQSQHVADGEKTRVSLYKPIDRFLLGAAGASLIASVSLWFTIDQAAGQFIGLWVPSILALWAGMRIAMLHCAIENNR